MSAHENKLILSASPQVSSSLSGPDDKTVVPTLLPLPPPYPLSKRLDRSSSFVKSCIMKWKKAGKRRQEKEDPFLIAMRVFK